MDLQDLTMGEIEEIEALAGESIATALASTGTARTKTLIGIAWVQHRKTDPTFTLDKARKLTMRDINEMLEEWGTDDPKD